ncbi:MAG TPA: hypothetical protein VIB79_08215 [Candidatus Binatia bacterium]
MVLLFAMVANAYFEEVCRTTNLISRVVTIFVGLFFAAVCLLVISMQIVSVLGLKKVIADGESLTIQNPFSKKIIAWKDITEFGTYTAGYHPRVRVFYVKRKGSNDEKILVCTHQLKNLKALIDTIFHYGSECQVRYNRKCSVASFYKTVSSLHVGSE